MNRLTKAAALTMAAIAALFLSCGQDGGFPRLEGPYLGQRPPGETPELFAPGLVSGGFWERDVAISPDGNELFYSLNSGDIVTIMVSRRENGRWTEPRVAPFASDSRYYYIEPCLTDGGRTILFLTTRPPAGQKPKARWGHQNIWAADRRLDGSWGEPYDLGAPIDPEAGEYFPSVTRDGTLYFTRQPAGGKPAIFRSRLSGGKFGEPERLPDQVNGKGSPYNAVIAPDESFLVACVADREDALKKGVADYFVFFRSPEDVWSEGINMGPAVNFAGTDAVSPSLSPDGAYFFFAAARPGSLTSLPLRDMSLSRLRAIQSQPGNGLSDIYWVDAGIIRKLKPRT